MMAIGWLMMVTQMNESQVLPLRQEAVALTLIQMAVKSNQWPLNQQVGLDEWQVSLNHGTIEVFRNGQPYAMDQTTFRHQPD